jgi:hypothetical protein
MKLFEMKHRPSEAGLAKIFFEEDVYDNSPPLRKGVNIALPDKPEAEFFRLLSGEQFLFRYQLNRDPEFKYWFGGTDELPFLARLKSDPFKHFMRGGEDSFYRHLKPELIIRLEERYGIMAKRQGDFFAFPLPYSWEDLAKAQWLCFGKEVEPAQHSKGKSLFGTRHKMIGLLGERYPIFGGSYTLGEGTINAPDHEPLIIDGQLHVILQARNLFEPEEAD